MKSKISKIMKNIFEIEDVNEHISQANTAEWDSLKHLSLVVELESEFNVEFEPEEIAEMKSFKDVVIILTGKGIY